MQHENSYKDNLPTSAVPTAGVTRNTVPSSTEIPAQTAVTDDAVPSSTEIPAAPTARVTRDTVPSTMKIPAAPTAGVTGDAVPSYRSCDMIDELTSLTDPALISRSHHCELSTAQHQQSTDIPSILYQVATSSYDFVPAVQCASTAAAITESRKQWHCNSQLCVIDVESLSALNEMLTDIITTASADCLPLYLNLNSCDNTKKNPYKLGHSLSCTKDNNCNSSLKHTRLLACHFSGLQLII